MHCCNWAVLSSITSVSVSSRRPRKALSEANSHRAPLLPGVRSYMVAGAVTKSPDSLSSQQTQRTLDAAPGSVRVALDGTASEAGHPEDREHEAHEADGDPDPGDEEQEDDPDTDECDAYADHRVRVPAQPQTETSRLENDEPLLGHLADRVGGAFLRVARALDAAVGHLVGPERGSLVDRDPAELERLGRRERRCDRAGEDPRLEPVVGSVRTCVGVLQRVHRV